MDILAVKSSIWITFAPVFVINIILLTSLMVFTFTRKRPDAPDEVKTRHNSKLLNAFFKEWWYWTTGFIVKFFIKIRLSPNIITFIGFLISVGSAFIFAYGLFGIAGWVMIFGATFDMFDGRVARITNTSCRSGAYFDSVMDRFGEGAVYLGLAYHFRSSWLLIVTIIALVGSSLVSYTRARGEGVGVVCKKGAMQRPERIVYLGVASIFQPVMDSILMWFKITPYPLLVVGALCIIALLTFTTAIQRMIYIMNELDNIDKDEKDPSLSQLITKFSDKENRQNWLVRAKYGYDRSQALKKHSVMILVDGANYDVFKSQLDKGKLPNIKKHIVDKGSFKKMCSAFPSTTGPAFTPFVTGCFPGTSNIPGIRWFDRTVSENKKLTIKRFRDYYGWGSYALDHDLSKGVKTIFEYSKRAINIMGMLNRGAGVTRDPAFFKIPFLFYAVKKKDDIELVERTAFRMFTNALKKAPDFVFYYFPTIDMYSHEFHSSHEKVLKAYERLDDYVGKIAELLKEHGIADTTSLMITSDHGHSVVKKHFDLDTFLSKKFNTLNMPTKFKEWQNSDAINMVSGNSMANIYFKNGGWHDAVYFEDLEKKDITSDLIKEDAIDIIAGRSKDGGIIVESRRGKARIIENAHGRLNYTILSGDPFGYVDIPRNITEMDSVKLTWDTEYPDGILQIAQIFRSERSGDLVVSAAKGYDLRAEELEDPPHSSTHGALHKDHMFVPFCINSDINHEYIRTVDVFPTTLRNLGILPDHNFDGRSLI